MLRETIGINNSFKENLPAYVSNLLLNRLTNSSSCTIQKMNLKKKEVINI